MPARARRRNYGMRRRRIYRRRPYRFRKRRFPSKGKTLFGNKRKVTFKYVEDFTLNPGIGTAAVHVFSANGMFDPNITGTGHQPRGFDQCMQLFDRYCVIASKCRVLFKASDDQLVLGIALKETSLTNSNYTAYAESRNDVHKFSKADAGTTVVNQFGAKRFLGPTKVLNDPNLAGGVGINPTRQGYYHVYAEAIDPLVDAATIQCSFECEYVAVLYEPHTPPES